MADSSLKRLISRTVILSFVLGLSVAHIDAPAFAVSGNHIEIVQVPVVHTRGSAPSGGTFKIQPRVVLLSALNETLTSVDTVTVTISTPQNGTTNGVLGGTTSVNTINGVASFTDLTITGGNRTGYTFTFTSALGATSLSIVVKFATKLVLITPPVLANPGELMSTMPVVAIADVDGNVVSAARDTVSLAFTETSNCVIGKTPTSLSTAAVTGTNSGGYVSFSSIYVDHGPGGAGCNFNFYSGILSSAPAANLSFTPVNLEIVQLPKFTVAGIRGDLITYPKFKVVDLKGYTVTQYQGPMVWSFGNLNATETSTAYYGVSNFNVSWYMDRPEGTDWAAYPLKFWAPGLPSVPQLNLTLANSITTLVSFNNGGATSGTLPAQIWSSPGAAITVPQNDGNLVKAGYVFAGWTTKAGGLGTRFLAGSTLTMPNTGYTLFADWALPTADVRTITYDANGAETGTVPSSETGTVGSVINAAQNLGSLQRAGYKFSGWNTKADGTGASIAVGGAVTLSSSDWLLYAKWVANTVDINYDGSSATSGTVPISSLGVTDPTYQISLNSGSLARTGYSFSGWSSGPNGTGTKYIAGSWIATPPAPMTLYAVWTAEYQTVSYSANGATSGTTPSNRALYTDVTFTVSANTGNLQRIGYSFAGWSKSSNSTTAEVQPGSSIIMPGSNLPLFAVWTQDPAVKLSFGVKPKAGMPGVQITTQPLIKTINNAGATNPSIVDTITVTSSGGILGGTTTLNTVNGEAQFTDLTFNGETNTVYVLTFTSSRGLLSVSESITPVSSGVATKIVFGKQPIAGRWTEVLTQQPVIYVQDKDGNIVDTSTVVTLRGDSKVQLGKIESILPIDSATGFAFETVTTLNGIATFSGLTMSGSGGGKITASTGDLPAILSNTLTYSTNPPIKLSLSQNAIASGSGRGLIRQPIIKIIDSNGLTYPHKTDTVTVTASSGTLSGVTSVVTVGGIATFSNLTFSGNIGETVTLTFISALGLASESQTIVALDPLAIPSNAVKLKLAVAPIVVSSGSLFGTQPTIQVVDSASVGVDDYLDTITVRSSRGTLTGTLVVQTVQGFAQFNDLRFTDSLGAVATLTFTSNRGLELTTVTITIPGVSALHHTVLPEGSKSGQLLAVQPAVNLIDSQGRQINTSFSVTVSLETNTVGILTGTLTATAVSGVATFNDLKISGIAGVETNLLFTAALSDGSTYTRITPVTLTSASAPASLNGKQFTVYQYLAWSQWIDESGNLQTSSGAPYPWNIKAQFSDYLKNKNIQPIWAVYENYFSSIVDSATSSSAIRFTAENGTDARFIDEQKVKSIALTALQYPTVPVSFDTEFGNRYTPNTVLPGVLELIRLFKKYNTKTPVGVYAVVPQSLYQWNATTAINMSTLTASYAAVANVVDFFSPMIYYAYNPLLASWVKVADYSLTEALKYSGSKPIIPYLSFNKLESSTTSSYDDATLRMQYLRSNGAAGAIIWESSGSAPAFNANAGWGKAMVDMAARTDNVPGRPFSLKVLNSPVLALGGTFTTTPKLQLTDINGALPAEYLADTVTVSSTSGRIVGKLSTKSVRGVLEFTELSFSELEGTSVTLIFQGTMTDSLTVAVTIPQLPINSGGGNGGILNNYTGGGYTPSVPTTPTQQVASTPETTTVTNPTTKPEQSTGAGSSNSETGKSPSTGGGSSGPVTPSKSLEKVTIAEIAKLNTSDWNKFDSATVRTIPAEVFSKISTSILVKLPTNTVAALTREQVSSIPAEVIKGVTVDFIKAVSPSEIPGLTTSQLKSIPSTVLKTMTPEQVGYLSGKQINATSGAVISDINVKKIAPETLASVSNTVLKTIPLKAVLVLATTQLLALTTKQVQTLTSGGRYLSNKQVLALAKARLKNGKP